MIGAVVWKQRLKMEAGPHIRGPSRSLFQAVRTESNAGAKGDMRSRVTEVNAPSQKIAIVANRRWQTTPVTLGGDANDTSP